MLPFLRRSPLLAAIAPVLAFACAAHGPAAPSTAPVAPASTPEPVREPIAVATPPAPAPTPTPAAAKIGWSSDLREQPKAARKLNSDALKRHRKGDYTGSLAGFDAAVAAAPDFALAHFNRACALTRLGRTADAAAVMRDLLAIDLLAYGPRLDKDADLAALRASPEFAGLTTLRAELVTQYAAAVQRGVPTQIYKEYEGPPETNWLPNHHRYRAGVWLTDSNTFVPITPELEDSYATVWSPPTGTVSVVHGPMTDMLWQVIPDEFTVDIYDLGKPGTLVRSHPKIKATFARLFPKVDKDPESWDMAFQRVGVLPLPDRTQIHAFDRYSKNAMRIEFGGPEPILVKQAPASGWRHDVHPREGMLVDGMPDGYTRTKSRLTVPGRAEPIELGKLHKWTSVVPAADNSAAFVFTQEVGCDDTFRHRLLRIDLKSYQLRELSAGKTAGALASGLDGNLYLQLGTTTRRLASDGALTDLALPPWLNLTRPLVDHDCYM